MGWFFLFFFFPLLSPALCSPPRGPRRGGPERGWGCPSAEPRSGVFFLSPGSGGGGKGAVLLRAPLSAEGGESRSLEVEKEEEEERGEGENRPGGGRGGGSLGGTGGWRRRRRRQEGMRRGSDAASELPSA